MHIQIIHFALRASTDQNILYRNVWFLQKYYITFAHFFSDHVIRIILIVENFLLHQMYLIIIVVKGSVKRG